MEYLKKLILRFKPSVTRKGIILVVVGVFVLVLGVQLIGTQLMQNPRRSGVLPGPGAPSLSAPLGISDDRGAAFEFSEIFSPKSPPPEDPIFSPGADAEDFEVTTYSLKYETRELSRVCSAIADLKAFEHVIFESSNERDRSCSYTFKVTNERADEVVRALTALDPKELNENTRTIKRAIEVTISEQKILEQKLAVIDETLSSAIASYDKIAALATSTSDVENLTKIINLKITLIERLTQSRLSVRAQLDRIVKAAADQNDRLKFTFFKVQVIENVFVDGEQLKDTWKAATRAFVRNANDVVLNVSINLIVFMLVVLQYLLYLFLLLIIAKYAWVGAKYIWRK